MSKNDQTTTISELKKLVQVFRDERDWKQFHTPKNLAQAISVEANELLEEFLWKTDEEIDLLLKDPESRSKIADELSDIMAFCLNFSNATEIDLTQAMHKKMTQNRAKYPIDKSKGNATKYTDF